VSAARHALKARISALITRLAAGERDDHARDALLLELAHYQVEHVPPYARFVAQRSRGRTPSTPDEVPALPTDAFRYARISSRAASEEVRRFRSSGTTSEERSLHVFSDLSLYTQAARAAARYALFPDTSGLDMVILAASEQELADSSLSYMLARFSEWFGLEVRYVWPLQAEELGLLRTALRAAESGARAVALLGTSFAFVHALDALQGERFVLPAASRIMQTGGFKGRTREVEPTEMRRLLADTFAVDERFIVAEYGMTELSSQLYERTLRDAVHGVDAPRRLWAPGWVRATIVDPETLSPLPTGAEGLVRIDDLANLDSVAFIQTADLGSIDEHGLILRGRASAAVARGCSITADELLQARRG
jgi:hypothetical protein